MSDGDDPILDAIREARAAGGWEPPMPFGVVPRLPTFPAHRAPAWWNDYVVAVAAYLEVPVDLPAMLALTALGAAAGGRAVAEVRPGWREPLNLYAAVCMPPGTRKTPVFKRVITPLEEAERRQVDAARPDVADAQARYSAARAKADKAMDDAGRASEDAKEEAIKFAAQMQLMAEAVTVPSMPRLLADDATPESLTSLLYEQGGRLAMFSDEGEVFSMMAGRYGGAGPNLGVYLKAHVGSPIRVDRKGRGYERIDNPALTLGLTIQPDMLQAVAGIDGARGRGLLGRFLWSVPPSNLGERDHNGPPIPAEVEKRYVDEMCVLIASLAEWTDPAVLVFTPEAAAVILAFERALEPRLKVFGGDLNHVADWASKLAGHVVRIAGLLHLATNVRTGWARPVQAPVVSDAVAIADYLIPHALVAFDAMRPDETVDNARALLRWIADRRRFSRRDAHRGNQGRFASSADLLPALRRLEEMGYIRQVPARSSTESGGRPSSPEYIVNPRIQGDGIADD